MGMQLTESELRQLIREQHAWNLVLEARGTPRDVANAVANYLRLKRSGELSRMGQDEFSTVIRGAVAELIKQKGLSQAAAPEIIKHTIEILARTGDTPRKRPDRPSRKPAPAPKKKKGRLASFFGLGESEELSESGGATMQGAASVDIAGSGNFTAQMESLMQSENMSKEELAQAVAQVYDGDQENPEAADPGYWMGLPRAVLEIIWGNTTGAGYAEPGHPSHDPSWQ
jgi:hypothetical protein